MELLYLIKGGASAAMLQPRVASLLQSLQEQGAGVIIAACTEAPLLMRDMASPVPIIDATSTLVEEICRVAATNEVSG